LDEDVRLVPTLPWMDAEGPVAAFAAAGTARAAPIRPTLAIASDRLVRRSVRDWRDGIRLFWGIAKWPSVQGDSLRHGLTLRALRHGHRAQLESGGLR
jgi:hypothetical protein